MNYNLEQLEERTMMSVLVGDMNHDGVVNAADASIIAQYVVHLLPPPNHAEIKRADFINAGKISIVDASIALTLGQTSSIQVNGTTYYASKADARAAI